MSAPNSPGDSKRGSNTSNKTQSNHSGHDASDKSPKEEVSTVSQDKVVIEISQNPPNNPSPSAPINNDSISKPTSPPPPPATSSSSPEHPSSPSISPLTLSSPPSTSQPNPHAHENSFKSSSPLPSSSNLSSPQNSIPTPKVEKAPSLATPQNLTLLLTPGLSDDPQIKKLSWRPDGLSMVMPSFLKDSPITEVISPHRKGSTSSKDSTSDRSSLRLSEEVVRYQSVRGRRGFGTFLNLLEEDEGTVPTADPEPIQEYPTTSQQLPIETKADKLWMIKLEQFTVKFLNKIFRRGETERKLKAATKMPKSCNIQMNSGGTSANETRDTPTEFSQEEEEEAAVDLELNSMLDEIAEVIKTISPSYLTLITPIFSTLADLKSSKDFRQTDNREIFRKVDDYEALVKCDFHICLNSVIARIQTLVEFINGINADSEVLKKFPRIITKCYSTESKICQEICEVYSDEQFQTVNIKKMCKLKPKPEERPPWRLSFKTDDICVSQGKEVHPVSPAVCPGSSRGPKEGGTYSHRKGSKFTTENPSECTIPECCDSDFLECGDKELKSRTLRRFWSALNADINPYPEQSFIVAPCSISKPYCNCGCCTPKELPNVGGILYSRFRAKNLDPDECPMTVDGYGTGEDLFPSITNIKRLRVLNHTKLFAGGQPKCCNPPKVKENCFGTGVKWNKQFPCGNRNTCCQESCKPLRDPRTCYPKCGPSKRGGRSRIPVRDRSRGEGAFGCRDSGERDVSEIATSTRNLGEYNVSGAEVVAIQTTSTIVEKPKHISQKTTQPSNAGVSKAKGSGKSSALKAISLFRNPDQMERNSSKLPTNL